MEFVYNVINWDINNREIKPFNIFQNYLVREKTEKEVTKYLRSPSKYKFTFFTEQAEPLYGFEAFVKELDGIIQWQEWCRYEYEISVGRPFCEDPKELKKIDCYYQAHMNIEAIAREVIRQAKEQLKEEKKAE